MNLLSIQDNLKGVSDQDLARMMQSPDSTAPSYLVLSEIRRRKDMRTKAGDVPASTVAEDLVDIPQTYTDREGIRGLRVPGYEAEQQDEEADTGAGIEAMRAGGIVRMADGGEVDLPMPPPPMPDETYGRSAPARVAPVGAAPRTADINMQDIMQRNMGLIPGIPEELMNRLREGRTNEPERRREAQSNALVEAGLRIAASNNPRLAGAIGEGALPAMQGYTQQRAQIRQDQRAELQQEMAAAQADIQRRYMAGQLSAAEYRSAMEMAGRREIAGMQIEAQRAQSGASQGAQDARLTRQLAAQEAQQRLLLEREDIRNRNATERAAAEAQSRLTMSAAQEAARAVRDPMVLLQTRASIDAERRRANPGATLTPSTDEDVERFLTQRILRTYQNASQGMGQQGAQTRGAAQYNYNEQSGLTNAR